MRKVIKGAGPSIGAEAKDVRARKKKGNGSPILVLEEKDAWGGKGHGMRSSRPRIITRNEKKKKKEKFICCI